MEAAYGNTQIILVVKAVFYPPEYGAQGIGLPQLFDLILHQRMIIVIRTVFCKVCPIRDRIAS